MTQTVDATSPNEPVIVVTRMFDASRELVWKAITDPKHVAQWYGGQGFTNPVCEMDLRPGAERLVWKTTKDEKRKPAPPTTVNMVTLEERGVQTKWTLIARFDSVEERDRAAGMGFGHMVSQGAERIAELIKTL